MFAIYLLLVTAFLVLCFYEHKLTEAQRTIRRQRKEIAVSERLIGDLLNQQKQDWKAEARVLAAPHVEEAMLFPYHRPYLVPDYVDHEPTDAMWLDAFAGTDILDRGDN
jgi:hypothetical protein